MDEPRFEEQMKRLEDIVAKIESGDVGLDDSIELCQEASGLVKALKKKLQQAELKVRELAGNDEEEPQSSSGAEEES